MEIGFLIALGVVALLYSSVGHGGASGYLALLSLSAIPILEIRPTALVLNLLVAGIAFVQFYRKGYFSWSLSWPFLAGSIPMAFVGGTLLLSDSCYKFILGAFLVVAAIRMLFPIKKPIRYLSFNLYMGIGVGMIIGFFSGLIGIGGGIILSPVMLLLGWSDVKSTAATSSFFIWVNSLAGLLGFVSIGNTLSLSSYPIYLVVCLAALIGGFLGSSQWSGVVVRWVLSFVLVLASVKLVFV